MGQVKKQQDNKSRRWFFSLFTSAAEKDPGKEKIKMLTADGKLVEIDKDVLDAVTTNKSSSNKEIFDWMKNPSKDNS